MTRAREIFRRIGTPDAVSWPTFWVAVALNTGITFSTGFDVSASVLLRVVVVAVSMAACWGWLLVFRALVLERSPDRPRPIATIVAFAIAGGLRGLAASAVFIVWLDLDWSIAPYRVISGAIGGVVLLTPAALFVSTARDYKRVRARLLARREQLLATRERIVDSIADRDEQVISMVESKLVDALREADPGEQADRLDQLAAEVVRPLSHELARSVPDWVPPPGASGTIRIGAILDRAASGRPLMPVLTALGVVVVYGILLGNDFGWPLAAAFMAIDLVGGALALWLSNRALGVLLRRGPLAIRLALVVGALALSGAVVGAVMEFAASGTSHSLALAASSAVFYTAFGVPIVLARAGYRELAANLDELEAVDAELTWRVKRLHMVQWAQQRGLARALHGPVQSSIAAAVQRLRSHDSFDGGALRSELVELLARGASTEGDSWSSGISRVQSTWQGLCEVHLNADDVTREAIDEDPVCADIAVEIVTEAVSNAVRHGKARSVEVSARGGDQELVLTVRDDGSGESGFDVGLGTRLLEDCALTWRRGVLDARMCLTVSLPMDVPR